MGLLLPALARAEGPSPLQPDLVFHREGEVLTVGSGGTWTLNRPGIDWLNVQLDHCDALQRELGECQGRAVPPPPPVSLKPRTVIEATISALLVGFAAGECQASPECRQTVAGWFQR